MPLSCSPLQGGMEHVILSSGQGDGSSSSSYMPRSSAAGGYDGSSDRVKTAPVHGGAPAIGSAASIGSGSVLRRTAAVLPAVDDQVGVLPAVNDQLGVLLSVDYHVGVLLAVDIRWVYCLPWMISWVSGGLELACWPNS